MKGCLCCVAVVLFQFLGEPSALLQLDGLLEERGWACSHGRSREIARKRRGGGRSGGARRILTTSAGRRKPYHKLSSLLWFILENSTELGLIVFVVLIVSSITRHSTSKYLYHTE